jgi:hypothetical protein
MQEMVLTACFYQVTWGPTLLITGWGWGMPAVSAMLGAAKQSPSPRTTGHKHCLTRTPYFQVAPQPIWVGDVVSGLGFQWCWVVILAVATQASLPSLASGCPLTCGSRLRHSDSRHTCHCPPQHLS